MTSLKPVSHYVEKIKDVPIMFNHTYEDDLTNIIKQVIVDTVNHCEECTGVDCSSIIDSLGAPEIER